MRRRRSRATTQSPGQSGELHTAVTWLILDIGHKGKLMCFSTVSVPTLPHERHRPHDAKAA